MTGTKRLTPETQAELDKYRVDVSPMATLILDENAQPVTETWSDWVTTCDLRWFSELPQKPARLQQRWTRSGYDSMFALNEWQHEWRDVPVQIGDDP